MKLRDENWITILNISRQHVECHIELIKIFHLSSFPARQLTWLMYQLYRISLLALGLFLCVPFLRWERRDEEVKFVNIYFIEIPCISQFFFGFHMNLFELLVPAVNVWLSHWARSRDCGLLMYAMKFRCNVQREDDNLISHEINVWIAPVRENFSTSTHFFLSTHRKLSWENLFNQQQKLKAFPYCPQELSRAQTFAQFNRKTTVWAKWVRERQARLCGNRPEHLVNLHWTCVWPTFWGFFGFSSWGSRPLSVESESKWNFIFFRQCIKCAIFPSRCILSLTLGCLISLCKLLDSLFYFYVFQFLVMVRDEWCVLERLFEDGFLWYSKMHRSLSLAAANFRAPWPTSKQHSVVGRRWTCAKTHKVYEEYISMMDFFKCFLKRKESSEELRLFFLGLHNLIYFSKKKISAKIILCTARNSSHGRAELQFVQLEASCCLVESFVC